MGPPGEQGGQCWGSICCRARGQLPPTLPGAWRMGPVLSCLAFEGKAGFKPKGQPDWLLALSTAFACEVGRIGSTPFLASPKVQSRFHPPERQPVPTLLALRGVSAAWQLVSSFP